MIRERGDVNVSAALFRTLRAAGLELLDVEEFKRDFGGAYERVPLAVVRAGSERDIATALRVAREADLPIRVRGFGHSSDGRTLSDGLVLTLQSGRAPELDLGAEASVRVFAGTSWRSVEEHLNGRGWACPVLTDYLDLSVGGTLTPGGYGVRSVARGAQVDHVRALRLVLPDGERISCSPSEHREYFTRALAGLAPLGVISEVELSPVPVVEVCELYTVTHRNWRELGELIQRVTESNEVLPDSFFAVREPRDAHPRSVWGFDRCAGKIAPSWPPHPALASTKLTSREVTREPRFRTHRLRQALLARFPDHVRLWQDFVCEADRFVALASALDALPKLECVPWKYALLIRKREGSVQFPFEAAAGGRDRVYVGIGLYFFVPRAKEGLIHQVRAQLAQMLNACLEIGGRPYRYGACTFPEHELRAVYGRAYDELVSLKRESDPKNHFHPLGSFL